MISKIHALASVILIAHIAFPPSKRALESDLDKAVMLWCFLATFAILFFWR